MTNFTPQQQEHFKRLAATKHDGSSFMVAWPNATSIEHVSTAGRTCVAFKPTRQWIERCPCGEYWVLWRGFEHVLNVCAMPTAPRIVCLCGSMRRHWPENFMRVAAWETAKGCIVLQPHIVHSEAEISEGAMEELKDQLDALHAWKIALADRVLMLDEISRLGVSTAREAALALALGRGVRYGCASLRGPLQINSFTELSCRARSEAELERQHEQSVRLKDGEKR